MSSTRSKNCACSPVSGGGPRALSISENKLTRLEIWNRNTDLYETVVQSSSVQTRGFELSGKGCESRVESAKAEFSATNASLSVFIQINT